MSDLFELLEFDPGGQLEAEVRRLVGAGADLAERRGPHGEQPLHVAVRRYRTQAVALLLELGADIDARTVGGKTGYAHAARRGFGELVELLGARGASTELAPADVLAVAVVDGRLDDARACLDARPGLARTGNPEEDRLLADVAGRNATAPVELLIEAGADLAAPGLDEGTPLHQAAWFAQPANARLLVDAGAPIDIFESFHGSSPLGWVVHGSRFSGGADEVQSAYVELARMLLDAGASLHYPGTPDDPSYAERLVRDATPAVRQVLEEWIAGGANA